MGSAALRVKQDGSKADAARMHSLKLASTSTAHRLLSRLAVIGAASEVSGSGAPVANNEHFITFLHIQSH